jgi:hypothetical protein
VAQAQGAAHLHTVAELQNALDASRQAEAAMRSHVTQQHQKMEEVQDTIVKTTEVCLVCFPPSLGPCAWEFADGSLPCVCVSERECERERVCGCLCMCVWPVECVCNPRAADGCPFRHVLKALIPNLLMATVP